MELALEVPEFLGRGLAVRAAGWFSGPRLLLDGSVVKGKRGRYMVRDNRGRDVAIRLISNHIDPIPKVTVEDRPIPLARALEWYEYVWMGLPILLAWHGGLLGALCGFGAIQVSSRIFRGEGGKGKQFLLTGLVSLASVVAFYILVSIFVSFLPTKPQ